MSFLNCYPNSGIRQKKMAYIEGKVTDMALMLAIGVAEALYFIIQPSILYTLQVT